MTVHDQPRTGHFFNTKCFKVSAKAESQTDTNRASGSGCVLAQVPSREESENSRELPIEKQGRCHFANKSYIDYKVMTKEITFRHRKLANTW